MSGILHITTDLYPDGAQQCLVRLVTGSRRFKHRVVTLFEGGDLQAKVIEAGVELDHLHCGKSPHTVVATVMRLRHFIHVAQPAIVHAWTHLPCVLAATAIMLSDRRPHLVWALRTMPRSPDFGYRQRSVVGVGRLLSRYPDRIIYNSDETRTAHEKYGYRSASSVTINNGIAVPDTAKDGQGTLRSQLGLGPEHVVMTYMKRLVGNPGSYWQAKFLEAAAIVARTVPEARFVCVGRDVDDPNNGLAALCDRLSISDKVFLLGHTDDTEAVLLSSDIYVSASQREGSPNAVAEAMSHGIPCVVTDAGGSASLVGEDGIVVPYADSEAMAREICRLVAAGSAARLAIGRKAANRVRERFSLDGMISSFEREYEALSP